jgi:hypothetical protein
VKGLIMEKQIFIYLKTHDESGLKYLGITKQNPHKYIGSGTRWLNHLKKHGRKITTKILFSSFDKKEVVEMGKFYSTLWDVVNNKEFANLKIEEGDGGFDHINKLPPSKRPNIATLKRNIELGLTVMGKYNWTEDSYERHKKARGNFLGKKHTEESKIKMSRSQKGKSKPRIKGPANSNYGKVWCVKKDAKDCYSRKSYKKDQIPEGWITTKEFKHLKKDKTNSAYGKHWFNDGIKNYFLTEDNEKIKELSLVLGRL